MHIPLLSAMVAVFAMAVVILLICHRLRIPGVVGLLITGLIAGPHGLAVVNAAEEVEVFAEIGVVLLLFTIGIEFSITKLFQIRRAVLLGGSLQVCLTTGLVYLAASMTGLSPATSLFVGFLVSLSSTAIVLKILHERSQIESPHGRTTLAVLIFQDLAIVPMMLFVPLIAGRSEDPLMALAVMAGKAAAVVAGVYLCSRFIVPKFLYLIARTRSREMFVLCAVVICLAVAWITSSVGLSLGLGAFLAGLIISESEYSHQALGGILPFRDVFTSFFFVSIGMLLDLSFVFDNPLRTLLLVIGSVALKGVVGGIVTLILRLPIRTMVLVGISIAQIGEFSFILADSGKEFGLIDAVQYQSFLAVAVLTMAATPFLMTAGPRLADLISRIPIPRRMQAAARGAEDLADAPSSKLENHLVIIGFGLNGRNVARAARHGNIPYVVIEMNADTVRAERRNGEPIFYGDASYDSVLEHAGIERARVAVVVTNDPLSTRAIIQSARRLNPELHLIARTRYVSEIRSLAELGASEVVPEEFETSVEIFARVLLRYDMPKDRIEKFIDEVREGEYQIFRAAKDSALMVNDLLTDRPGYDISVLFVDENSSVVGATLERTAIRTEFGVTVLEIRRDSTIVTNPSGSERLNAGDTLMVLGEPQQIRRLVSRFGVSERTRTRPDRA